MIPAGCADRYSFGQIDWPGTASNDG